MAEEKKGYTKMILLVVGLIFISALIFSAAVTIWNGGKYMLHDGVNPIAKATAFLLLALSIAALMAAVWISLFYEILK